jgi:rod shape determining protein RodA
VRADFTLLLLVLILSLFGAVMVASATRHTLTVQGVASTEKLAEGAGSSQKLVVQIVSIVIGLGLMLLIMSVDYSKLLSLAPAFMVGTLALLLITVVLGHAIKGSSRWIPLGPVHLQPSEFAKVAVILLLAFYLSVRAEDSELSNPHIVLHALGLTAVPAALIILQPDLGTPIVLFFIWLVVSFALGAKPLHLGGLILVAVLLGVVAWHTHLLHPYQKARITAFLDPNLDPHGAGYNLRQSLIAVGSGHLKGEGLFQGSQSNLAFLPEQETDFIFAVVGEELGFAGAAVMLLLLAGIVYRCYRAAAQAKDPGGRALAAGVAAMLSLQLIVNVGMVLGMMPVKGLPLPFVSYGGSATLANFLAVGLVESVYMRRHKIAF